MWIALVQCSESDRFQIYSTLSYSILVNLWISLFPWLLQCTDLVNEATSFAMKGTWFIFIIFLLMMFKCKLGPCSISHIFSMIFCESINLYSIYSKIFAVSSWQPTFWVFKDRLRIIGAHLMVIPKVSSTQTPEISGSSPCTHPPS